MYYDVSGVDSSKRRPIGLLPGRPHGGGGGGLVVLYKRCLADKVKTLKCKSRRLCAITLSLDGHVPLLLINVYMPCDTMSVNNTNDVYSDVLCNIESLMADHVGDVGLLLCGDWNTDTTRRTAQTPSFNAFNLASLSHRSNVLKNCSKIESFQRASSLQGPRPILPLYSRTMRERSNISKWVTGESCYGAPPPAINAALAVTVLTRSGPWVGNQRSWYVQPCLCDWVIKGLGMSSRVYVTG